MCVFVFVCVYVCVCVCVCVTVCDCVSLRFSLVRADPTYSGSCGSLHQKVKKGSKESPPYDCSTQPLSVEIYTSNHGYIDGKENNTIHKKGLVLFYLLY